MPRPTIPVDGARFRSRMAARGVAQVDAARLVGVHPSAISRLLAGRRSLSIEEAVKLGAVLGETPEAVMLAAGIKVRDMEAAALGAEVKMKSGVMVEGVVVPGWRVRWGRPSGPSRAPAVIHGGPDLIALRVEVGMGAALDGAWLYLDDPRPKEKGRGQEGRRESVRLGTEAERLREAHGRRAVVEVEAEGTPPEWVVGVIGRGHWAGRFTVRAIPGDIPVEDAAVKRAAAIHIVRV